MLYVTTRGVNDAFTAHKALTENVAPDGGMYIPFRLPTFDKDQIEELLSFSFCECMSAILNRFFPSRLSAWDVETCIGRNPVRLSVAGRKTVIAETWYTPGVSYEYAVSALNDKLLGEHRISICSWVRVAVGIAYLFATYAQMRQNCFIESGNPFDISVLDGDFTLPAAALYCAQMGLPINRVIICSKRNSAIWDLINHGKIGTSLLLPDQKIAFERLICILLGENQVEPYVSACCRHGVYAVPEDAIEYLQKKLFGAVVGNERIELIISNVSNTNGYKLSSDAAVCFCGVQDYRAKTGQTGITLVWNSAAPDA